MRIICLSLVLFFSQFSYSSDLVLAKQIKLKSKFLDEERNLLIKLPVHYGEEKATYPVLYVLHAQWDMLSVLSTLDLLENEIPDFIVVGVESKGMELRPSAGEITPFSKYLSQEVVPYIKQHYKVAPLSILSGHSNSGRFVLDYWLNDISVFSQYYAFSPSLEDGYIVERASKVAAKSLQKKAPLVITIANEGEHMQAPFDKLSQQLGALPDTFFIFTKFPDQSHRTTKHSSMQFALQSTFRGWNPTHEVKVGGLDGLRNHYSKLEEKFGFKVDISNETLQKLIFHYAISDGEEAVRQLDQHIAFTIKQSDEDPSVLFEVVDYLLNNDYQEAGNSVFKGICRYTEEHTRCQI